MTLPGQSGGQPGVYFDGAAIRIDVRELLIARGIEPTNEAVEISARNLAAACAELGVTAAVIA